MFQCECGIHVTLGQIRQYLRDGRIPLAVEAVEEALRNGPQNKKNKQSWRETVRLSSD